MLIHPISLPHNNLGANCLNFYLKYLMEMDIHSNG